MPSPVRIVAISDTHAYHEQLEIPPGDILVHAGDLTQHGDPQDVVAFNEFLGALPHRHKVVIAGNHDFCFERTPDEARALLTNAIYLQDESATLEGLHFYGSPWQPEFFDWAFNLPRGAPLRERWDRIPSETDILVTHGPPRGHGDRTARGERVGCDDLLEAIARVRPSYHIFGHIHEGYGQTHDQHTTYINASSCDLSYRPVQAPVVFEIRG